MPGLYIHIPFCEKKCSYCAFYSLPSAKDRAESFLASLEGELGSLPDGFEPDTIFIGGGTPTALSGSALEQLCSSLKRFSPAEFSCEVNPGTADGDKLEVLRRGGVNRLSIGVQSFDRRVLELLGRIHSAEEAEAVFRRARSAGFSNISLDLMFGIPGQTMEMLEADLERVVALGPEHVSVYNLMLEEGTPLAESCPELPEEALEVAMYSRIRERLAAAGFGQYEISSFSRPGFECAHNRLYWSGGEYIGVGPAAHSHWGGVRWAHVPDLEDYCRCGPRREFEERLDGEAKARETLVMGLRQMEGVEVSPDLWAVLGADFRRLEAEGLLVLEGRRVRLSEDAVFISDAVFAELV